MSTLGTARVRKLKIEYPAFGGWRVEGELDVGDAPAVGSTQTLTVGTLVLVGKVLRAALDAPDQPGFVLAGGAGWKGLVARPLSYQSDTGVRLATVLKDLAAAAGETIEQPTDTGIGSHYECIASRPDDPVMYRDALDELAMEGVLPPWRVDPDGVTRFGARVGVEVTARATVLRRSITAGHVILGIDDPLPFLPGNTIGGIPIANLVVREENDKLEAEVWTSEPNAAPSIRASVQRMVWRLMQEYVRTYVVAEVRADKRLDLVPPPDAQHLPEMNAVEQWTLGGALVTPVVGAEVAVLFRDRRRTRPFVVAFGPGVPEEASIDGEQVVLAQGEKPTGRGGAKLKLAATVPASPVVTLTDPDGLVYEWEISGIAPSGGGPVTFTVVPSLTVGVDNEAVIDPGRAEVLV